MILKEKEEDRSRQGFASLMRYHEEMNIDSEASDDGNDQIYEKKRDGGKRQCCHRERKQQGNKTDSSVVALVSVGLSLPNKAKWFAPAIFLRRDFLRRENIDISDLLFMRWLSTYLMDLFCRIFLFL